ncbi:MAG: Por secretion system protein, partial [Paludibacter sp.]|nr:Por secretion system protein [Paludibacter sp.]
MKKNTPVILLLFLIFLSGNLLAQRQLEKLNRGLVAVKTSSSQIFLSWRVLGSDPDNVAFNLYRDGVKLNATPITTATNYTDPTASATTYTVKTVIDNVETGETNSASVWSTNYLEIPMNVPAAMTMPDGSTCTYSPNDCSVGDVDGDGEFELVVKWEPSNAKDNSQSGYTGDVYLDVYKLNGSQLCRIDLGKNIRAGAHYTDFEVDDFDGDGKAEIICKTAPGTKDGLGNFLSKGPAASDNDAADYRTQYGYILSGPEYLTCFSGLTGEELSTVNYVPARGTV